MHLILAPLRGVTLRGFRETFADEIRAAGFTEALTPFITATPGYDPLKDRELKATDGRKDEGNGVRVTPQFLTKDATALHRCLERIRDAGYETADLNAGCPFPMVRNKGRGSGLLRTPDILRRLLDVGCEVMGEGAFSLKTRLGVERGDELLALMPLINGYPLRFLTVHARTAKQMYGGDCDFASFDRIAAIAKVPLVYNGDVEMDDIKVQGQTALMIGRGFIRTLGRQENAHELALRYLESSQRELPGDHSVLGRMKEFLAYWKDLPAWHRRWNAIKLTRTVEELRSTLR